MPNAPRHPDLGPPASFADALRAARAEPSPLHADDVRMLLDAAASGTSSTTLRKGPLRMFHASLLASSLLVALAGTATIRVILPSPAPSPVPPVQQAMMAPVPSVPTPDSVSGCIRTAIVHTTSGTTDLVALHDGDADIPALVEAALSADDVALPYLRSLASLDVAHADRIDICEMTKNGTTMRHVTLVVDGKKQEVIVPSGDDAPLPMLVTTATGQGQCLTSVPPEIDPNSLIPVTSHRGSEPVVMWFAPTSEFLSRLPDDVGRDLGAACNVRVSVNSLAVIQDMADRDREQLMTTVDVRIDSMSSVRTDTFRLADMQSKIDSVMANVNKMLPALKNSLRDLRTQVVVIRSATAKACANLKAELQELARTSSGVMTDVSVFPNPVTQASATLQLTLLEGRTVTVTVTDLGGQTVATAMNNVRLEAGQRQIPLSLPNVPSGMYTVSIVTDRNEQLVKRLIVQ